MALSQHLREIHDQAVQAAFEYRKAEAGLIHALVAVECDRVFESLGFASLLVYAVESLGLSEGVAYNAITVARKVRQVPELGREIDAGTISISKAKKIASVLTKANQVEWLEKAKTLPSRKLEKEVARVNPRAATPEKATYASEKRLDLSLGVSEELMIQLRQIQDQVSQSTGHAATLEETIQAMANLYLKKKDPVQKAKRVIAKKGLAPASKTIHVNRTRTPIPAAIKHAVRLRDQGRCQHENCGSRRWIDFHHIIPVSEGGPNTAANLITLCRAHHKRVHHDHERLSHCCRKISHRPGDESEFPHENKPPTSAFLLRYL